MLCQNSMAFAFFILPEPKTRPAEFFPLVHADMGIIVMAPASIKLKGIHLFIFFFFFIFFFIFIFIP